MADIHPMQAIRDRLWRVASDVRGDDDEVQAHMRYRMRLWALNVAADISEIYTKEAEDASLAPRVISAFREQQSYDAVVDVDSLYDALGEVSDACERLIELESIEEGIPALAAARAAIMAIEFAVTYPDLEDLRALGSILANVPEQAALAFAYKAIDAAMDEAGTEPEVRTYFIIRETSDMLGEAVEEARLRLGTEWLADLERRLDHGKGMDIDPASGRAAKDR